MNEPVIIGTATLYHADCMAVMARYPDKHFDLACVDPPYGVGMDGNNNWSGSKHEKKDWDNAAPDVDYFSELIRVSKNQIVWGANHFMDKLNRGSPCWLVWDKKNDGFSFADAELAYTSFETAVRFFRYHRGEQTDTRIHPTQKPVKLYEWLLTNYAKSGDKILDTHGGSMSSVIACLNLGYEIVCAELDTDYFNAGVERVKQSQKQQRMF